MCAGEDVQLIRRVRVLLAYRTDRADVARVVALVRLKFRAAVVGTEGMKRAAYRAYIFL
jgi:hypothetical protein